MEVRVSQQSCLLHGEGCVRRVLGEKRHLGTGVRVEKPLCLQEAPWEREEEINIHLKQWCTLSTDHKL